MRQFRDGLVVSSVGTLAGTPGEIGEQLRHSGAERAIALTFAHESEGTVRVIAEALGNLAPMVAGLVKRRQREALDKIVDALVPTVPLPEHMLVEARMTAHARSEVLASGDWLTAAQLAELAGFSAIVNAVGKPIPTLYGGTNFNGAAMESIFHDVPFAPGLKTYARHKFEGQRHSVLAITATLTLADLRNVPLRKLGVERKQLIDTEKDTYGQTRKWAQAIHAQHAHIQGLCWTSRQDDSAMALMLFGDRISADLLAQQGLSLAAGGCSRDHGVAGAGRPSRWAGGGRSGLMAR